MRSTASLISVITVPFVFLNAISGVVSCIWLAFLGQWGSIGIGLLVLGFGSMAASFLLLPSTAMAGIAVAAMSRGQNALGFVFGVLGSILTIATIICFEVWIFRVFGQRAARTGVIFPTWLWSYGIATGVWGYLAGKEGGEVNASLFYAFAAQVAYVVLSIFRIWLGWPLKDSIVAMAVPLALPLLAGIALIAALSRAGAAPFRRHSSLW